MTTTKTATITDWLDLVRAEYHEIPGLHLTKPQVQRLWGIDRELCDQLLELLTRSHFLRRTRTGAYVRAE